MNDQVKQLVICLGNTLSTNNQTRKEAEETLKQIQKNKGYPVFLLKIILEASTYGLSAADVTGIQHAASIQLKRIVITYWVPPEIIKADNWQIDEGDKKELRAFLLSSFLKVTPAIRNQLGLALAIMAENDLDKNLWPELIPEIMKYIESKEMAPMYCGLEALRLVLRNYQYRLTADDRKPLNLIVEHIGEKLLSLFVSLPNDSPNALELKLIFAKIFHGIIHYGVPPAMRDKKIFHAWMQPFFVLLQENWITDKTALKDKDDEDLERLPIFKCKKWVARIFSRLYQKYGYPKDVANEDKAFVSEFIATFTEPFLKAFGSILQFWKMGVVVPEKLLFGALSFIQSAIRYPAAYRILKTDLETLIKEILFPLCCFTAKDQETWKEDPVEFLRREHDMMDEFYSAKFAAMQIIVDLGKYRAKNHLNFIMQFLASKLMTYSQSNPKNYAEKDGVLLIIGWLESKLKTKAWRDQLEPMITAHILPEFDSPAPFLRAKACWIFGQYWDAPYKNEQVFLKGLEGVLKCLEEKELPIKIQAALSMRFLLQSEQAREPIRKILPQLLNVYLKLMKEMDNDSLVNTLEILIETYSEEMKPYALSMTEQLRNTFFNLENKAATEDEGQAEDAGIAAIECLGAIQTLLQSVGDHPDLFPELEKILLPLLKKLVSEEATEFFEETCKIISFLTFFNPTISKEMWTFFPEFHKIQTSMGIDFIGDLLVPMDNMISKSTDYFLQAPKHVDMALDVITGVLTNEHLAAEGSVQEACRLIEVMLHACRGKIDHLLDGFLQLTIPLYQKVKNNATKVMLVETAVNVVFYNPVLALSLFEKKQVTQIVFEMWFSTLPVMKRAYDKKLSVLALSALLTVPVGNMPAMVQHALPNIVDQIIKIEKEHVTQVETQKKEEGLLAEDDLDDDDEDEDEAELSDDEQDKGELQNLVQKVAQARQDEEDDDDDFDDFEDDLMDDDYQSIIDNEDELAILLKLFQELSTKDPYSKIFGGLPVASHQVLKELADYQQQKLAAKQQQQQQKL